MKPGGTDITFATVSGDGASADHFIGVCRSVWGNCVVEYVGDRRARGPREVLVYRDMAAAVAIANAGVDAEAGKDMIHFLIHRDRADRFTLCLSSIRTPEVDGIVWSLTNNYASEVG